MHVRYLILGAGPTGLGAAHRLRELGCEDFLVLERDPHPGGLSASFTDPAGFTWDVGGHVVFSHYPYFDRLLDDLLGGEHLEHQRKAFIRLAGTWVPYPFQNNIRHLPPHLQWECVEGLLAATGHSTPPRDFQAWILGTFGPGIARVFMLPYNFKVWAVQPEDMAWQWIGERVSVVDVKRVLRNLILGLDDVSWGPNNLFRFPLRGGTGEIFRRLASRLDGRILYRQEVTAIDAAARTARTTSGLEVGYDRLLNTGPLDLLVLNNLSLAPDHIRTAASGLRHNSVHVQGVGLDGNRDDDTCWMYFPEADCPFYRVTNFHNYSPRNTARPGHQRALMAEVSSSAQKPERISRLMDRSITGLERTGLMADWDRERIVSTWEMSVDYGYPIPSLERDRSLGVIQPWLESLDIFSRGRFGGWKYEVGNMDHSVMQGVEWAQRMVAGTPETTYAT